MRVHTVSEDIDETDKTNATIVENHARTAENND